MTIRKATDDDIPALVAAGQVMHSSTQFSVLPFSASRLHASFHKIVKDDSGRYAFLVALNHDKQVVGALIGVMEQHIFSDAWTSSVMHIDVLPEARMAGYAIRLISAFENWSRNRGAVAINFGINSGVDLERTERLLRKLNYKKVGGNFCKACK